MPPEAPDPLAEHELCRELVPRVRAFALRRTRDAALAADVAQEVALITIDALRRGRVDDPAKLPAFALGVARRLIAAQQRGERRRAELLGRFAPLTELIDIEEHGVDRRRVARCLEQLTARARTIVALTFFAERSAEEIGRELGAEPGAIRVARHRALAQLHACMGGRP